MALQPRSKGVTDQTALQEGEKLAKYLSEAGFTNVRVESKNLKPILAVCAIGFAPPA